MNNFFSFKNQIVITFGFEGHSVFVTTIQLCSHSTKVPTDDMYTNRHDCVLKKLYSQKTGSILNLAHWL